MTWVPVSDMSLNRLETMATNEETIQRHGHGTFISAIIVVGIACLLVGGWIGYSLGWELSRLGAPMCPCWTLVHGKVTSSNSPTEIEFNYTGAYIEPGGNYSVYLIDTAFYSVHCLSHSLNETLSATPSTLIPY